MYKQDGNQFLQEVTEKLRQRIDEIQNILATGQKEIENMQEYFWENYTEMDEYGYEYFDNQQALLRQENANRETLELHRRFLKMKDSPFFGRVDFLYDGDSEPEIFYIGIANFAEKSGHTPLIYDWRAPVSSLFYDYDGGAAQYEAPGGTMSGEILSKWQYKIRHGEMVYALESELKIDDEILKRELSENGDVRLKNIVQTIQREQNAIIRNTKDRILVVQGAAGSGKTSVALHRIAYLLYHDRAHLKSSDILILSPNSVFSDYISHILPELGEENIKEMSFDLFAYKELKGIAPDCEDRYHQLERKLKNLEAGKPGQYEWKQSKEYIAEVEGYLLELEEDLIDIRGVSIRKWDKTEDEIVRLFYYKFQEIPLLKRLDSVMEYVIDEYETLSGTSLSEEEKLNLQERFDTMYVTKDIYVIYSQFMEKLGFLPLPDVPYEKRFIEYEDVFPILYLKFRLLGKQKLRKVKHLVIDEMQDYSYLQYVILEYLFSCKMTILGDKEQTMDETRKDVLRFLPKIFGKEIRKIVLNKSYRSTYEIADYACRISGISDLELLKRHGKPVETAVFVYMKEAVKEIQEKLKLLGTEAYETAAVLTRTEEQALEVYALLKNAGVEANYIDRDSSAFKNGLTITTFYLAKGLEFDQVFAVGGRLENGLAKQADYISATRALHELYMMKVENEDV